MDDTVLLFSRDHLALAEDRVLRLRCQRGELVRIVRGVYTSAEQWSGLDALSRYGVRLRAIAALHPKTQFSHESAAALWGLPLMRVPQLVHARVNRGSGQQSTSLLRRHAIGLDRNSSRIGRIHVTSLAATVADACTLAERAIAISIADAGLRTPREDEPARPITTKAAVLAALEDLGPAPGAARARRLLELADPRAESVGESFARLQLHAIGFPAPDLQQSFFDVAGKIGQVDFAWEQLGLIAEFDGAVKYGDLRRYARDRSAQQVLVDEKRREDRLRALGLAVVRLDWATIEDPLKLRTVMAAARGRSSPRFGRDTRPRRG